jgi:hypothetical protein
MFFLKQLLIEKLSSIRANPSMGYLSIWHSTEWHSAACVKQSARIGAADRSYLWVKDSGKARCEGCKIAYLAVQKFCERWYFPGVCQLLEESKEVIRINITGDEVERIYESNSATKCTERA